MKILGIESTCDETGVAIVEDGQRVVKSITASSVNFQKKYGGVVPEVAAREQIKVIIPIINEVLKTCKVDDIDAIAVSHGPGLIGSLLIGTETAKVLALVWNKPLIPVNHLAGHIYANWISLEKKPEFPLIGLIVSGGHTDLILMRNHGQFKLVGTTLDDSCGEAFDKVARLLGLSYPGGPEIEKVVDNRPRAASNHDQAADYHFPRPMINSDNFNFSFSGLKTAVVSKVASLSNVENEVPAIAAEFQKAIIDILVKKTIGAAEKFDCDSIVVGGGVAANLLLRSQMTDAVSRTGKKVFFPSVNLSVDNGAMIAAAAFYIKEKITPLKLSVNPILHF